MSRYQILTIIGMACGVASVAMDFEKTPALIDAARLLAIRAGTQCEVGYLLSYEPCSLCLESGENEWSKCTEAPGSTACRYNYGPCWECTSSLTSCDGDNFTYTDEQCMDNEVDDGECERAYSIASSDECEGTCI